MRCDKCGAILDDDSVFCYKCGSFVMNEEAMEPVTDEKAGKRSRGGSSFWFYLRTFMWVIVAAAGVAAAVLGYKWIDGQRIHGKKKPDVSDRIVWGESWVAPRWSPPLDTPQPN